MSPRVSVLLICERAEQLTGSGCCGKLEGDNALLGCGDVFGETRERQESLGILHRTVRQFFRNEDLVCIIAIDPRNQPYLIPKLLRDVWHYRPGWTAGVQTLLQMFSLPAVIVNGQVLSRRGNPLAPDALCHKISELLERDELRMKSEHRDRISR